MLRLIFLSLAVSAASLTLSKAEIFLLVRGWLWDRSDWLGRLITCPYCTSFWVAFGVVLVYQPRIERSGVLLLDLFVSALMIVALSVLWMGVMWKLLQGFATAPIPKIPDLTYANSNTTKYKHARTTWLMK